MASVNPADVAAARGNRGLDGLIAEVDKLVSLPDIYYRLEQAIADPTSRLPLIRTRGIPHPG